jgi:hypothetical protein
MSTVYIAARFDIRDQLLHDVVRPLHAAGHSVTSRWVSADSAEPVLDANDLATDISAGIIPGTECLEDIKQADVVAVFTDAPSSTGGYHVELGYALGLGKRIEIVGPALNVFHALPQITRHATVADFLQAWTHDTNTEHYALD